MNITNILISGVGGQGLVMATNIISKAAFYEGYDIKTSDVIGLSQRGGLVWGCVRFGSEVPSPLIPNHQGDILLAMEQLEALRWIHLMKSNAKIIINEERIYPNRVLLEKEEYPEVIPEVLEKKGVEVYTLNANNMA
ncbi:MAG: pyruvate ferredoxin/flavodoxin oxidoreductase, partial [Clostridiales bacterium]|nr:pyruvate ferredoxin/flavodoxin oxidoreductase [Clostridiales bacterium]